MPARSTACGGCATAGKPVVLLSNAPRRAHVAQEAMRGMGIPDALYTGILTSGEQTHRMLRDRDDPFFAASATACSILGRSATATSWRAATCSRWQRPQDATFVLNTGPDDLSAAADLDALSRPALDACRARRSADGLRQPRSRGDPRRHARDLRRAADAILRGVGGEARWVGKPDPAIYGPVLAHARHAA